VTGLESSWTTGLKKVLVVRVNFPDDPAEPCAYEDATCMMAQVQQFYDENSYGQLHLEADITPVFTLPRSVSDYANDSRRHLGLREDALAAAKEGGYVIEEYHLDIVLNGRLFGYRAQVGARGCWLQSPNTDAAVHELGHNFGLGHANLWVGRGDTIIGPGRMLPYGNMFDAMADVLTGAWPYRHFNAAHKHFLGWLPPSQILAVTNSGVYELNSFDTSTLKPGIRTALTIRKDPDREYWIEARQNWIDNPWAQNGVLVYFGPWDQSYGTSPLLDTTPNSHWPDDSRDAPLLLGRTFSDCEAGVHVTPLSRSQTEPGRLQIRVVLGHFPDNQAPLVTFLAGTDPVQTEPGQPLVWTALGTDPDDDPVVLSWDFGDNTYAGNTNHLEKSWSEPGDYLVRCWVSDMKGGVGSVSRVVRVGQPGTCRVSGRVVFQGRPLAGVRVSLTDSLVTYTDADGCYTAVGLTNGTYQLHPGKGYYTFQPASRSVFVTHQDVVEQNFEAIRTETPNNPPYVMTWNPSPEAIYGSPAQVPLRAWAYDDGEVQLVQFTSQTGLAVLGMGNSFIEVWTNIWSEVPPGEHLITVQALDDFGAVGQALPTRILVAELPARLESIVPSGHGGMSLNISGPVGQSMIVEASADLVNWTSLVSLTNSTGLLQWTDSNAFQFPQRFYRIHSP
jgi:hypothetical protein